MPNAHALVLDQQRSLTSALMVLLGSEGLRIPSLDTFSGQERYGPVPLGIAELLLLEGLRRGGQPLSEVVSEVAAKSGATEEHLREVVTKLWERGLLIERAAVAEEAEQSHASNGEEAAGEWSEGGVRLVMGTPRLFRMRGGKYEALDHEGRVLLSLLGVELAAASEFRQPMSVEQAYERHAEGCGEGALGEGEFKELVERLGVAELLKRIDSQEAGNLGDSVWDPVMRRGRTIGRERFQGLNESIRQGVREFDAAEEEREQRSGHKRVRVVCVQENATIFPLALGMIVAYAKAHEGGRLNEHYAFHPDWLVRPSKVRSLTQQSPAIFLFSNYSWSHHHNLKVSKKVKQLSPWSVTIHGGPNTPKYEVDSEVYFRDNPDVDITVRGEGEAAVAELLSALVGAVGEGPVDLRVLEGVPGITYRDGERVVRTGERPRIVDLDSIPSPILTGLFDVFAGKTELGIIETNRGCPYSCTFCDWGSAIATKVRKFSIERVYEELEWCAQHQVDGIMVADANFGMYERDLEIAEKVAELKKEYGYPTSFSSNFAKNTTTHLKRIIEVLTDADVISTSTLAVQSMDPTTLSAIKRSNIKLREYDALATEFRKADLPLFMDLMFGLPGQTLASFQNDLQGCIDRGVFPRMYMTELLINSPMNEPSYREAHRIRTEPSLDGSRHFVVSTSTFSRQDYEEMNGLRRMFALCDIFGMLREIAHYVRSETGMREIDFYEQLRRDIREDTERWPVLAFSVRALPALPIPPASWGLVMEEARRYLIEMLRLEDNDAMRTVLAVQLAVLPVRDRPRQQMIELRHDYASWHRAMVQAKQTGHHADWPTVVPKLSEFEPAYFNTNDHEHIGKFGIGPALYGVQPETSVTERPEQMGYITPARASHRPLMT